MIIFFYLDKEKPFHFFIYNTQATKITRMLVLLLLQPPPSPLPPPFISFFLSYLKLAIPVRFKIAKALIYQDSETLKHFGCSSKMTSSCSKWPINLLLYYNLFIIYIFSCHNLLCFTGCAPYWWRYSRKEYCKPYEPAICKYTHAGASRVRFV